MILFASFVIGTAFGSFIGVVAQRLHVKQYLNSRSKCLSCSHELAWKDMIPIVSCLSLRGRCRYCKCYFGYSHLFFELAFGLVSLLLAYKYLTIPLSVVALLSFAYYYFIFVILGIIFLYDSAHKIIPRRLIFIFIIVSTLRLIYDAYQISDYTKLADPFFVALPYFLLFLFTLGRGVGFGDILLYFGVGSLLGIDKGFLVLLLSLWIGTFYTLPLLLLKKVKARSAIAFAPFIITAFTIVFFSDWSFSLLVNKLYFLFFS